MQPNDQRANPVRVIVRSIYDMQNLRIQTGNRLTANFKQKLGQKPSTPEDDLEKEEKKILDDLRADYQRITDGVVAKHRSAPEESEGDDDDTKDIFVSEKLPTRKKFKGEGLITTFTELVLVHQYLELLSSETKAFKRLKDVLGDYPIYTEFLAGVSGCGPAMAGVIISEIDIYKAEYAADIWKYAGLDVITLGRYINGKGEERIVSMRDLEVHFESSTEDYLAEGKYPVTFFTEGRSRKAHSLVEREYTTKDGDTATRLSITFNPFLKTKLVGVLGSAFLKASKITVDGKRLGGARRLKVAKDAGYKGDEKDMTLVDQYLRGAGFNVVNESSPYNIAYYDYKARLENNPAHATKSPAHRHNMAVRYAVKRFISALYVQWRTLEGLVVSPEYHEAKLGIHHGQAKDIQVNHKWGNLKLAAAQQQPTV